MPSIAKDDVDIPDIFFLLFDDVFVYDHHEKVLWIITHYVEERENAEQRLRDWEELWMKEAPQVKIPFESQANEKRSCSFHRRRIYTCG